MSQPISLPPNQGSTTREGVPRPRVATAPLRAVPSRLLWDGNDEWRQQANCRQTDPALFFPVGSTGMAREQIQAAKAVCRCCPVRQACLDFALQTNQEAGIWGGTSEEDRRRLRRR